MTSRAEDKVVASGGVRIKSDAPLALRLAGFVGDSIVDGPGLRCAVFCQGCPHACPGCHNPATHPFAGGTMVTTDELYQSIKNFPLCRGVTFSGGEPFSQPGPFVQLAKKLKAEGYELASYTGFTFEELQKGTLQQKELLQMLDVLIDGRFVQQEMDLTLRFRGSKNQRILNVPQSVQTGKAIWEKAARWVGE